MAQSQAEASQVKEDDDGPGNRFVGNQNEMTDLQVLKSETTSQLVCNQNIVTFRTASKSSISNFLITESKRQIARNTAHKKIKAKHPWFTKEFIALLEQREMLRFNLKINPNNTELRKEYILIRNRTSSLRKKLRWQYQVYLEEL